ncbi:MAG: hypothetical protein ACFCVG_16145, partial [Kineosporiaceae bacterium]
VLAVAAALAGGLFLPAAPAPTAPDAAAGAVPPARAVDVRGCGWFLAYDTGVLRSLDRSPAVAALDDGRRAVLRSAVLGDTRRLREALAAGAPADVVAPGFDHTPLTAAVAARCASAVTVLLDAGADPGLRLPGLESPLAAAVLVGDAGIARQLVAAGADPDAVTSSGVPVREVAILLGQADVVAVLDGDPPAPGQAGTGASQPSRASSGIGVARW